MNTLKVEEQRKRLTLAQEAHRILVEKLKNLRNTPEVRAEVVSLIVADRSITVEQAIEEWDPWARTSARSERTRRNTVTAVRQWSREAGWAARASGM